METLYVNNDMYITLEDKGRLKDTRGDPIPGASIEVTVFESDRQTEVSGVTWPLEFSAGEEVGEYFVVLPASLELVSGKHYVVEIKADTGAGKAMWKQGAQASFRY